MRPRMGTRRLGLGDAPLEFGHRRVELGATELAVSLVRSLDPLLFGLKRGSDDTDLHAHAVECLSALFGPCCSAVGTRLPGVDPALDKLLVIRFGCRERACQSTGRGRLAREGVEPQLQPGDLRVAFGEARGALWLGKQCLLPAFLGLLGCCQLGPDAAELAGHSGWLARCTASSNGLVDNGARILSLCVDAGKHRGRE